MKTALFAFVNTLLFAVAVVHAADSADPEKLVLREKLERCSQELVHLKGEVLKQQQAIIVASENAVRAKNEMDDVILERVKAALEKSDKTAAEKELAESRAKNSERKQQEFYDTYVEMCKKYQTAVTESINLRIELERERNAELKRLTDLAHIDLKPASAELIQSFLKLLENKDWGGRWQAIMTLGQLGADGKAALPALSECMKDKEALIRVLAAESFWKIDKQPQHVVNVLVEALKTDAATRPASSAVLARIGMEDASVVGTLAECLAGKDEDVAWSAGMALLKIGKKAEPATAALKSAEKDDRKRVALIATEVLKVIEARD